MELQSKSAHKAVIKVWFLKEIQSVTVLQEIEKFNELQQFRRIVLPNKHDVDAMELFGRKLRAVVQRLCSLNCNYEIFRKYAKSRNTTRRIQLRPPGQESIDPIEK